MFSRSRARALSAAVLLLLRCSAMVALAQPGILAPQYVLAQEYSTCRSWQEVVEGKNHRYAPAMRVSDPGTKERPIYTGFWFFEGLQFDESGRYALAMKVDFKERDVTPSDRGEIGTIDLADNNT